MGLLRKKILKNRDAPSQIFAEPSQSFFKFCRVTEPIAKVKTYDTNKLWIVIFIFQQPVATTLHVVRNPRSVQKELHHDHDCCIFVVGNGIPAHDWPMWQ